MAPGAPLGGGYGGSTAGVPGADARRFGVLVHPTSFPGPLGAGDLGDQTLRFLDWLHSAGGRVWQVLPLVPPERVFWSPYSGEDANCGNVLLLSLEELVRDGLLDARELPAGAGLPAAVGPADFASTAALKEPLLAVAARALVRGEGRAAELQGAFHAFCAAEADWLEDAALFSALSRARPGLNWWDWEPALRDREAGALEEARGAGSAEVAEFRALQFLFHRQWSAVKAYANARGISIVGDMPIYVGGHSADVWANRHLFEVDDLGRPQFVSGVPPDAFSETGQLWGSPLYDWPAMERDGFRWWVKRLRRAFNLYDETRIDHFRGFAGYWAVAAGQETAMEGEWRQGPGKALFTALRTALGDRAKIMAEDLGVITPDVVALRESIEAPGMVVLQFAFDGNPRNPHKPHNHYENCYVYTGTHDNDTSLGWFQGASEEERARALAYLCVESSREADMPWALIEGGMASVAATCIIPLQDIMGLDNDARMNLPGTTEGNWAWRAGGGGVWEELSGEAQRLRGLAQRFGRNPPRVPPPGKRGVCRGGSVTFHG